MPELVNIVVKEISGVDSPANGKRFLITKKEFSDDEADKNLIDKAKDFLKAVFHSKSYENDLKALEEMHKNEINKKEEDENVSNNDNKEHPKDCTCPSCTAANEVQKSLSDLKKRFEESEKQNEELRKTIQKQQDEKAAAEFIAKAKEYTALGVKAEEFGPVLKTLSDTNSVAYQAMETILKAANTALQKSGLFDESGASGGDVVPIEKRVESMAQEIRKKDPTISIEKARTLVWETNPEFYFDYEKEKSMKGRH